MVEYMIDLSPGQILKLRRGHSVRIPHSGLSGKMKVMLTPEQAKKLDRAKRAMKGSILKLSPEQISGMLMSGGSLFDTLKSAARKFKGVVAPVARGAVEVLKPVASELFKEAKGRLKKKAQEKALEVGKSLLDKGLKRIGAGRGRPRKVKGGFSFGDVVSGISKAVDVVKPIYEVGKPIIDPLAKAGFDLAKARMMRGRGMYSQGGDEPVPYTGMVKGGFNFSKLNGLQGDYLKGLASEGVRIAKKARDITKPIAQVAKSLGLVPDDPRAQMAYKLIYGDGLAPPGMALGRGMKRGKGKGKKMPGKGLFAPGQRR